MNFSTKGVVKIPPVNVGKTLSLSDIQGRSADSYFWHMKMLGIDAAHEKGLYGEGVTIAIIDTGYMPGHNDLAPPTVNVNCTKDKLDDLQGHGTHCYGSGNMQINKIGYIGACPKATFLVYKALDNEGSGYDGDVARAIRKAVDDGADVITMSLGGGGNSDLRRACYYAYSKGVIIVAASGNESATSVSYPAAYDTVISVGAVDRSKKLAWFSNTGTALDVVAPGVKIVSTSNRGSAYVEMDGTSMATPLAAYCIVLYIQAFKQMTNRKPSFAEVRAWITETAIDLDTRGYDTKTGAGLINVLSLTVPKDKTVKALSLNEKLVKDAMSHGFEMPWTKIVLWLGIAAVVAYVAYMLY